ncbi:AAA family ATPase [Streptomyces sp. M2CJ-2]|uniref:helix-turn-helix transcriptional regulator n=1 Tax=Streptomyces sp. M2CJ-2 TaxID=2803948 RepID=UPI0027DBF905|nr:AAA family ATPase [Streptomyces sp. M2CJ-2]
MLVQREEQLTGLQEAFCACQERERGHVALVTGTVGSGKTQLLEAFGTWAVGAGGRMLRATGSTAENGLPLGVIGQLFHSALLEPAAAARIDELLRSAFDGLSEAPERPEEPFTGSAFWAKALHGIYTSLVDLADAGPLVIAVDDVHHTDAASWQCLLYVIRRLRRARIMIVLAEASMLRPTHPLFRAELLSQPCLSRFTLPPLTADAVACLVDRDAGGETETVTREAADRFHSITGGNPLLVRSLIDERAGGRGPAAGDAFDQAVLRCLYRHEPGVRRAAQALAVLNRAVPAELLGQLLDVPPDSTVPALRVLCGVGLTESGRLRHPRILHSILADMSAEERRRLHQRAAEVLHEHGAEAGEVARHLVAAAWTDAPWVVPVLQEAADNALFTGRPDMAATFLRLVTRVEGTPDRRIEATAMLVSARWQINPLSVNGHLSELVEAARTSGWSTDAALSAVPYLLWQGRADEAVKVAASTFDDFYGADTGRSRAMRLLLALSHPAQADLVREAADTPSREAIAPDAVRPTLQAVSVLDAALAPAPDNDVRAAAEQLLQRHHADDGALGLLTAPLLALLWSGFAARAAVWGDTLLARPAVRHAPTLRAIVRAVRAEAALRLGDLTAAEQQARAALEDIPEQAWAVAVGGPLGTLVGCATEAGRFADADRWLAHPVPAGTFHTPLGVHYLAARGRHHHAAGRPASAIADLRRCGELLRSWNIDVAGLAPWRLELARVQLDMGDRTHAAQLLQEQLSRPSGVDDRTRGRALRLLAATVGADHRRKMLAEAVNLLQGCGDRPELARALHDTSQMLQHAGDSARARLFVRRAHQLTRDTGVSAVRQPPVRREPAAEPASKEPERTVEEPRETDDEVLSEAERRVAVLAAQGCTNRQISTKLFITVSTVEQHLTRVYRKLDVKRRTDLPERLVAYEGPLAEGRVQRTEAC